MKKFEILQIFPFTSESKRMGIILKDVLTNQIIFYLKGADVAVISKVKQFQRGFIMDECDNLAREGLRTLVFAEKVLTEKEYIKWLENYEESCASLENRKEKVLF